MLISYGESVAYMNDEANLEEASKEVFIKLPNKDDNYAAKPD